MSEDKVVTFEDLREAIRREHIEPERLYDPDYLERWLDGRLFARQVMAQTTGQGKSSSTGEDGDKYLDPSRNPLIKTS